MAYGFVESEGEILGLLDADERGIVVDGLRQVDALLATAHWPDEARGLAAARALAALASLCSPPITRCASSAIWRSMSAIC